MRRSVPVTMFYGLATLAVVTTAAITACGGPPPPPEEAPAETPAQDDPQLTKLYVFDCGHITLADVSEFSLSRDEVSTMVGPVPCFLIEHEQGTLMWDLGLSDALHPDGMTAPEGDPLAGSTMMVDKTMTSQLAELGYAPGDIDYFAMSHMHFDHSGNANLFQDVTWLAREAEREYAFGEAEGIGWIPEFYEGLRDVEPVLIEGHHDVFGDGTVVIRSAPGHTPGHQTLYRLGRDWAGGSQRRPLSLSSEPGTAAGSAVQLRRSADPSVDGCCGGVPRREWCRAVD